MAARQNHKLRAKARAKKAMVIERYGDKCFYCKTAAADTIDHFIPISKGGTNDIDNLRPACYKCNEAKKDLLVSEDSALWLDEAG